MSELEGIEFPPELEEKCNELIIKNFVKYGNSWKDGEFHTGWWINRIKGEVEELKEAINHEERRKELLDIINICRMMYYNETGGITLTTKEKESSSS